MEYRLEHDTMGEVRVPADRYWGAQTQRSFENFRIGTEKIPPEVVRAFAVVKLAAARANAQLGVLDARRAGAIETACHEIRLARRQLPACRLADRQRHADEYERQRGHCPPRQ